MRTCRIIGCDRHVHGQGLCGTHYMRLLRNGDPAATKIAARGTGWTNASGYHVVGKVFEHIAIAERALGHKLPQKAVVHHADENPGNNEPSNLVICPSQRYHKLLHLRMAALAACGNPAFRKCAYCGKWDDPLGMIRHSGAERYKHRACDNAYQRAKRRKVAIATDADFA